MLNLITEGLNSDGQDFMVSMGLASQEITLFFLRICLIEMGLAARPVFNLGLAGRPVTAIALSGKPLPTINLVAISSQTLNLTLEACPA